MSPGAILEISQVIISRINNLGELHLLFGIMKYFLITNSLLEVKDIVGCRRIHAHILVVVAVVKVHGFKIFLGHVILHVYL